MRESTVRLVEASQPTARFHTGVCLHGHTMHSEECLSFLPRYLHYVPGISQVVRRYEHGPRGVDFARAWWTPPLSPAAALALERDQIAALGLRPFVSLSDHDNIEAGLTLNITADRAETPISVEWTVPYHGSIFHLGIHNLPRRYAQPWLAAMLAYTTSQGEQDLSGLLEMLASDPRVLIVLNHPFWLEEGVTRGVHRLALRLLLSDCLGWFDAFELNGTRPWKENTAVRQLAQEFSMPLISGGDRHACEPSACINLTNAATFAEFVGEIRSGLSTVVLLPHYAEPMSIRVLEASRDILRRYPEYPDREFWTDRIFYRGKDGVARSVGQIWGGKAPWLLGAAAALVEASAGATLRPALRAILSQRGELHS